MKRLSGNMPVRGVVVAATPPGNLHEIGALLSSVVAVMEGFEVTFLGANTPLVEIARAVEVQRGDLVFLSIIYPPRDESLVLEFMDFMNLLPSNVKVFIGGRGRDWYADRIDNPRVEFIPDLKALRERLMLVV
jgi:cobalamin-dependent methionine synthase I